MAPISFEYHKNFGISKGWDDSRTLYYRGKQLIYNIWIKKGRNEALPLLFEKLNSIIF